MFCEILLICVNYQCPRRGIFVSFSRTHGLLMDMICQHRGRYVFRYFGPFTSNMGWQNVDVWFWCELGNLCPGPPLLWYTKQSWEYCRKGWDSKMRGMGLIFHIVTFLDMAGKYLAPIWSFLQNLFIYHLSFLRLKEFVLFKGMNSDHNYTHIT